MEQPQLYKDITKKIYKNIEREMNKCVSFALNFRVRLE